MFSHQPSKLAPTYQLVLLCLFFFLSLGCQRFKKKKKVRADQQSARRDPVVPARLGYVTDVCMKLPMLTSYEFICVC